VQHAATRSRESRLDMRVLQPCAHPCATLPITRNEQESGSSPLVGSPEIDLDKSVIKPRCLVVPRSGLWGPELGRPASFGLWISVQIGQQTVLSGCPAAHVSEGLVEAAEGPEAGLERDSRNLPICRCE
jgi:hypothetical protein